MDIYESFEDTINIYVARIYSNMGIILYYYGMYNDALIYTQEALNIFTQLYSKESTNAAALYNVIGVILDATGNREEGLKYKHKALTIFKKIDKGVNIDVADVLLNLGASYEEKSN